MPNVLHYIKDNQYDSFYDHPINELDILALSELSYLPFNNLVPNSFAEAGIRLDHLAQQFKEAYNDDFPPFSMVTKNRLTLLYLLAEAKRFKYIKAFAFIDDYQAEQQKQFAAISFQLDRHTFVTCFRGTDDTIIGWKEDFHMTYMEEIPAQLSAHQYILQLMNNRNGIHYIAGHSKGGNLALYAACQIDANLQDRIQAVYTFDAPGLHKKYLEGAPYHAIEERVYSIIPEHSIVGMMLETPNNTQVVHSNTFGFLQHISFSWEIEKRHFKLAPSVSEDSLQIDQTLKTWTATLTEQELEEFFDLLFGMFIEAGIERFSDITIDPLKKLRKIDSLRKKLSPKEADMIGTIVRLLFDTRFQIWLDGLEKSLSISEFRLQEWWDNIFS